MNTIRAGSHRLYLLAEFGLLFLAIPLLIRLDFLPFYPLILLWILAAACLLILARDKNYDRNRLWRMTHRKMLIKICCQFAIVAGLLAAYVAVFEPHALFWLPRHQPLMWAAVVVLYSVLSVYPQAIVYRAFFFYRYRVIFGDRLTIVASAAAFSYMHLIFENLLAVILTLLGGLLFANTYAKSRSLVLSSIEHALYGVFIFTIGLGKYFYYGAVP